MTTMLTLARTLAENVLDEHRWSHPERRCACKGPVSEEEWPGHLLDKLTEGGVALIASDRLEPDVLAAALHEIEHRSTAVAHKREYHRSLAAPRLIAYLTTDPVHPAHDAVPRTIPGADEP
ncbi:hypothetical protein [Prescottella agglutinans]|uniref:Uncharacterized protein n=1 Tax=Prescottella agglutinans TaxID=1644129 RepID=A0ABT6MI82_9NOCA|nr:hypothetical protein [Prescottella agglutinans]MDH6284027.1 hypothetical protein [Prescottella agglutinans]